MEKHKHKHKFKNIAGGCMINPADPYACDDHYRCKCGLDFKLKTIERSNSLSSLARV